MVSYAEQQREQYDPRQLEIGLFSINEAVDALYSRLEDLSKFPTLLLIEASDSLDEVITCVSRVKSSIAPEDSIYEEACEFQLVRSNSLHGRIKSEIKERIKLN